MGATQSNPRSRQHQIKINKHQQKIKVKTHPKKGLQITLQQKKRQSFATSNTNISQQQTQSDLRSSRNQLIQYFQYTKISQQKSTYQSSIFQDSQQVVSDIENIDQQTSYNDISNQQSFDFHVSNIIQSNKQLISQYRHSLGLYKDQILNSERIKQQFHLKINLYSQKINELAPLYSIHKIYQKKQTKIKILKAYIYLNNLTYNTHYSNEQIQLIDCIVEDNLTKFKQIIKKNKYFLNFKTQFTNYSLLYIASMTGNNSIVKYILQSGCYLDFKNCYSTSMHVAAWCGHYHTVKLLLDYGIPAGIKNKYGNLPIEETDDPYIQQLLKKSDYDHINNKLIQKLIQKDLLCSVIILTKNGKYFGRKLILKNSLKLFDDHVDTFHGTQFKHILSIIINKIRKPGTIVGEQIVKIPQSHIGEDVQYNGKKEWAKAIYTSPSIYYAGYENYAIDYYCYDIVSDRKQQQWAPIVQVKLLRNCFEQSGDTTQGDHIPPIGQPALVEYRTIEDDKIEVIAIILVRRQYLRQNRNYDETMDLALNSIDQQFVKQNIDVLNARIS